MSNAIFPVFPGQAWPVQKTPSFMTRVQKATSGVEMRASFQAFPLWTFKLTYEYLSASDVQSLMAFFVARQGQFDSFLFNDPSDNAATTQNFGTGDGLTTQFTLQRTLGTGATEFVNNPYGTINIYDNGTLVSPANYTIVSGVVTFNTAPTLSHALTWSGSYYYRVRFTQDTSQFQEFMYQFWSLKELSFLGSVSNRV